MTDFILIEGTYINKNNICFIESRDIIGKKKHSKHFLSIGFSGIVKDFIYFSSEERNKILNKLTSNTLQSVVVETPIEPVRSVDYNQQHIPNINKSLSSPYNPCHLSINNNVTNIPPPPPYMNNTYPKSTHFNKVPNI